MIVDGSNLLFQMFYGMPARIVNAEGRPVHGTLGFIGALMKILRVTRPRNLAVLFDGERENDERVKLMPGYKAGRRDYSDMPEVETPFSQIPDIERVLDHIGGYHKVMRTYEVDDIISSCVARFGSDYDIVIASQDSDLFQLVRENVKVLRYRGGESEICDVEYVRNRYGVEPEKIIDFKSLVGDRTDNIEGVRGVGQKIAAGLIAEYGDLENIIENAEKITRPAIRASIIEDAERLRRNYRIIRLRGLVSPPFDSPPPFKFITNSVTTVALLKEAGVM